MTIVATFGNKMKALREATIDDLTRSLYLKEEDSYKKYLLNIKSLHNQLAAKGKYDSGQNIIQSIEISENLYKELCSQIMTKVLSFSRDEGFDLSTTIPLGAGFITKIKLKLISHLNSTPLLKERPIFREEMSKLELRMYQYLENYKSDTELGMVNDEKIYKIDNETKTTNNITINEMKNSQIQQGNSSSNQNFTINSEKKEPKQSLLKRLWMYLPGAAGIGSFFINLTK
jgi:hypothetical protein